MNFSNPVYGEEMHSKPIICTICAICGEEMPLDFYSIPICADCKKTIINMRKVCKRYSCFACVKSNSCDMAYTFFGDCENFKLENS